MGVKSKQNCTHCSCFTPLHAKVQFKLDNQREVYNNHPSSLNASKITHTKKKHIVYHKQSINLLRDHFAIKLLATNHG